MGCKTPPEQFQFNVASNGRSFFKKIITKIGTLLRELVLLLFLFYFPWRLVLYLLLLLLLLLLWLGLSLFALVLFIYLFFDTCILQQNFTTSIFSIPVCIKENVETRTKWTQQVLRSSYRSGESKPWLTGKATCMPRTSVPTPVTLFINYCFCRLSEWSVGLQ